MSAHPVEGWQVSAGAERRLQAALHQRARSRRTATKWAARPVADAWLGLTLSPNGRTLWVGGGSRAAIFEFASMKMARSNPASTFELVKPADRTFRDFIGDVAVSPDGHLLYACDLYHDSIVVVNPQSGTRCRSFQNRPPALSHSVSIPMANRFSSPVGPTARMIHHQTSDGSHIADATHRRPSHRHGLARSRRGIAKKKAPAPAGMRASLFRPRTPIMSMPLPSPIAAICACSKPSTSPPAPCTRSA